MGEWSLGGWNPHKQENGIWVDRNSKRASMLRNWCLWVLECKGVENGTTAGRVHLDASGRWGFGSLEGLRRGLWFKDTAQPRGGKCLENTCLLNEHWDSSPFLHLTLRTQQLGLLSDSLLQHLSTELTREEVRDFLSSYNFCPRENSVTDFAMATTEIGKSWSHAFTTLRYSQNKLLAKWSIKWRRE